MNLLNLFRKPHTQVKYVVATRDDNKLVRQRRADRRMELEIMAIHLTPEQRSAALSRAVRGVGK